MPVRFVVALPFAIAAAGLVPFAVAEKLLGAACPRAADALNRWYRG